MCEYKKRSSPTLKKCHKCKCLIKHDSVQIYRPKLFELSSVPTYYIKVYTEYQSLQHYLVPIFP
jgi:hypothetical protein